MASDDFRLLIPPPDRHGRIIFSETPRRIILQAAPAMFFMLLAWWGWDSLLATGIFALIAAALLARILLRHSRLTLTEDGIRYWAFLGWQCPWSDVDRIVPYGDAGAQNAISAAINAASGSFRRPNPYFRYEERVDIVCHTRSTAFAITPELKGDFPLTHGLQADLFGIDSQDMIKILVFAKNSAQAGEWPPPRISHS